MVDVENRANTSKLFVIDRLSRPLMALQNMYDTSRWQQGDRHWTDTGWASCSWWPHMYACTRVVECCGGVIPSGYWRYKDADVDFWRGKHEHSEHAQLCTFSNFSF